MARPIRVAAAGDVHCDEVNRDEIERAFARIEGEVDAILLAGDLTTYGELEQGELLAEICAPLETPIYAVLGNHDWHCNQAAELTAALEAAGVADDRPRPRDPGAGRRAASGSPARRASSAASPTRRCRTSASRSCARSTPRRPPRSRRSPRASPRSAAATTGSLSCTTRRPRARSRASRAASTRSSAPTALAAPIVEHHPHLALHGHAHVGAFQGAVGDVPVYNVSVPSLARGFFVFELDGDAVHVA